MEDGKRRTENGTRKKIFVLSSFSFLLCSLFLFAQPPLSYEAQHKFDYFYLDALRLKQKGEWTNAFNELQYALQIDSTSSAALFELSNFYLLLKKEDRALAALQKAVKYTPDNFEYKRTLAGLYRQLGKNKESIALYEALIEENPQNPELRYYLSNLYIQQDDPDKAIAALNGLEDNMGMSEMISIQKYQLYKSLNKNNEALKEIQLLAEKFPMDAKYQILIGDFYLENNQADKALPYYEKAAAIDPDEPYYFIAMSNYYYAKGEEDAAVEEIEKALKNPALDIEAKLGVLGRYIDGLESTPKDLETANTLFQTLMEQHSQDKELNRIYGQFLLSQGKTEEAKFQFRIATEAMPDDLPAWTQLLEIVLQEERPDEVIEICKSALVHFPDVPEFYYYEGMAYSMKKEYFEALDIYKEGMGITPSENRTLLSTFSGQIADVYYQLENKKEAYTFYDRALQYNDKNIVVLNNYAYYLALAKEHLNKAERMAATVIQLQPNSVTYLDTYAWVFFQKGNYSLAKFYIESAISKNSKPSADILEHYGDILFQTGNIDQAVSEWQKAMPLKKLDGENTDVLQKKIENKMYYEK